MFMESKKWRVAKQFASRETSIAAKGMEERHKMKEHEFKFIRGTQAKERRRRRKKKSWFHSRVQNGHLSHHLSSTLLIHNYLLPSSHAPEKVIVSSFFGEKFSLPKTRHGIQLRLSLPFIPLHMNNFVFFRKRKKEKKRNGGNGSPFTRAILSLQL